MPDLLPSLLRIVAIVAATGLAGAQTIENVTLLGSLDPHSSDGYNEVWGFVDEFGTEYALLGTGTGVSVINIDTPAFPYETGFIAGEPSVWRDMKTYGDYAYVVTEGAGGALQIIDLSDPENPSLATTWFGFDTAHNIFIETDMARAYVCGHDQGNGGVLVLDLLPGPAPTLLGTWDTSYVHDLYVDNHVGYLAEILDETLRVVDFSNPASITTLAGPVSYDESFTHNTWATADQSLLFTTDELTEAYIKIWDVSSLPTLTELGQYRTGSKAIPHNVLVEGDFAYISYYREGLRILEFSDPLAPGMVGAYDTSPLSGAGYNGAWGIHAGLPSGNILVGDIETGLYVFEHTDAYGLVQGSVTESVGATDLAGVELTILETGKSYTTTHFGRYTMSAAAGNYTLQASKEGYFPQDIPFSVVDGATTPVDVVMVPVPNAPLSGVVRGDDGLAKGIAALAGAHVQIVGTGYMATSDGSGAWIIPDAPIGSHTLRIRRIGFGHVELPITVAGGGTAQDVLLSAAQVYLDGSDATGWELGHMDDTAIRGLWAQGVPVPSGSGQVQPGTDSSPDSGDNLCFFTANAPNPGDPIGAQDVDGGFTTLTTPVLDLTGLSDPHVAYSRWYVNEAGSNPASDVFTVEIKGDLGVWEPLEDLLEDATPWQHVFFRVEDVIPGSTTAQLRFIADDALPGSIVEAAIDDVELYDLNSVVVATPPVRSQIESGIRGAAPNPFNPSTRIQFEVAVRGRVELDVFDLRGRHVARLVDEIREPGSYEAEWRGEDAHGRTVASGVYVALLAAPDRQSARKLVLTK